MPRIIGVLGPRQGAGRRIVDSVILGFAQRRVHRGSLTGMAGQTYEVDLSEPATLRMADLLLLEDGGCIEVVAEAEPLIEVRAGGLDALARIAWHLGDRHVPVEVLANRLRLRRDSAIETLLGALGARIVAIEAPFNPEGGAYLVEAETRPRPRHGEPDEDHRHAGHHHGDHRHHQDHEHDH